MVQLTDQLAILKASVIKIKGEIKIGASYSMDVILASSIVFVSEIAFLIH